jgi:molybdate transport system substrate-binding protein
MQIQPPWLEPPQSGVNFTVPEVDNVPDLHGDIVDPQLVIFFNGNQFMVVKDLIKTFQQQYPQYERIYVQTLPPGILAQQIEQGALVIGNLRIAHQPDVYTAGEERIRRLDERAGWFARRQAYARNRLALMVHAENPARVSSLLDLGRDELRVSMPNPEFEGIGKRVEQTYEKAGGKQLLDKVMREKVQRGSTFLTRIHHRQTPMRILQGKSDVGPVWRTEVLFQQRIGNPIGMVEIPAHFNQTATYIAAQLKEAPRPQAAADFLDFLISEQGQVIYHRYGFQPVD